MRSAWTFGLVLALTAVTVAQPARSSNQSRTPEDTTIRTADGWNLQLTYYPRPGQDTPVVILLHGKGGNRLVWKTFATQLNGAGYAVVAVDLRKHGDSQAPPNAGPRAERFIPTDYGKMVAADLEAVKDFLLTKHEDKELNIRKLGIVAADDMAVVAANWAVADWSKPPYPDAPTVAARTPRGQDVRALLLLSPSEAAGRLNIGRALTPLKNFGVAVWIAVGVEDAADKGTAQQAYERLTAGGGAALERTSFVRLERVKTRGTELLNVRGANVEGLMLKFLDDQLKSLKDKWQTRKSRLQ